MARKCYVTGLGSVAGNNRSHSLQATRRTWKANLQKVRIKDDKGRVVRVYVSTRALRTMAKNGSIERA
jgi:large subunit ribosomal protein L28